MCGICGIFNFDEQPVSPGQLKEMMARIKHRGPDDEGLFLQGHIGLGAVRLSILDLSPAGHQPMTDHTGRYVLVYNGEIYNYIEIRDLLKKKGYRFTSGTDTEVLLYSWIQWGKDCLSRLNGMFAFALLDTKTRSLFAARDRFGIKPFYYYHTDRQFIFASEQRAILALMPQRQPRHKAIYEYLVYNRTDQGEETFFQGIRKLAHGCCAALDRGEFTITRWYDLQEQLKEPFQEPGEFYDALRESIKLRLRSDVPVGVCLSGGLDSSTIVSLLLKEFQKNDLDTFSAVYPPGEKADESDFIHQYREHLNHMHFTHPSAETLEKDLELFTRCHSEPVATLGPYAQFKVMQLAREHVTVTLDGQGADEALAGYHTFFGAYFKELLLTLKGLTLLSEISAYIKDHKSLLAFKYFFLYMAPRFLKDPLSKLSHNYITGDFYRAGKRFSDIKAKLYNPKTLNQSLLQHFNHKLEHLLKWEDHNSMWHSIEARVPFLDHHLVERVLSLPPGKIIKKATTKYILRQAMKGILPEEIRTRKDKVGFATPWEKWFRSGALKTKILDVLNSRRFKERGFLHREKCLKHYRLHLEGKINIPKETWKWLNLELWFRQMIDQKEE